MTLSSGSSTSPVPVKNQALVGVGHQHHGLQPPQIAVGAPILGQLDASPLELIGKALELRFQALEQGEGVGGRSGEAGDDVAAADAAHFPGAGLDDGLAEAHLAVAGDHNLAALADGQDRRAVPSVWGEGTLLIGMVDIGTKGLRFKA